MFCPSCNGEYRPGIDTCPSCGVGLTAHRPKPTRSPSNISLAAAARLGIAGTVVLLLIRTIATVSPGFNLIAARVSSVLYLASYAAILFFFAVFLREAVSSSMWRLKIATWIALAGAAVGAAIVALNLLLLFNRPVVSSHDLGVVSTVASILLPVTSALFFAGFLADLRSASPRLFTSARLALVGALLSAAGHAVVGVVIGQGPAVPARAHPFIASLSVPIVLFAVGSWIWFLWNVAEDSAAAPVHPM